MPVLVICRFDEDLIKNKVTYNCAGQRVSLIYVYGSKGQVITMRIVRSAPKSNSFKILWLSKITYKSDEDSIKNKIAIVHTTFSNSMRASRADHSHANSQKWGKKNNLSQTLCLSLLSASLIKVQSKMKSPIPKYNDGTVIWLVPGKGMIHNDFKITG